MTLPDYILSIDQAFFAAHEEIRAFCAADLAAGRTATGEWKLSPIEVRSFYHSIMIDVPNIRSRLVEWNENILSLNRMQKEEARIHQHRHLMDLVTSIDVTFTAPTPSTYRRNIPELNFKSRMEVLEAFKEEIECYLTRNRYTLDKMDRQKREKNNSPSEQRRSSLRMEVEKAQTICDLVAGMHKNCMKTSFFPKLKENMARNISSLENHISTIHTTLDEWNKEIGNLPELKKREEKESQERYLEKLVRKYYQDNGESQRWKTHDEDDEEMLQELGAWEMFLADVDHYQETYTEEARSKFPPVVTLVSHPIENSPNELSSATTSIKSSTPTIKTPLNQSPSSALISPTRKTLSSDVRSFATIFPNHSSRPASPADSGTTSSGQNSRSVSPVPIIERKAREMSSVISPPSKSEEIKEHAAVCCPPTNPESSSAIGISSGRSEIIAEWAPSNLTLFIETSHAEQEVDLAPATPLLMVSSDISLDMVATPLNTLFTQSVIYKEEIACVSLCTETVNRPIQPSAEIKEQSLLSSVLSPPLPSHPLNEPIRTVHKEEKEMSTAPSSVTNQGEGEEKGRKIGEEMVTSRDRKESIGCKQDLEETTNEVTGNQLVLNRKDEESGIGRDCMDVFPVIYQAMENREKQPPDCNALIPEFHQDLDCQLRLFKEATGCNEDPELNRNRGDIFPVAYLPLERKEKEPPDRGIFSISQSSLLRLIKDRDSIDTHPLYGTEEDKDKEPPDKMGNRLFHHKYDNGVRRSICYGSDIEEMPIVKEEGHSLDKHRQAADPQVITVPPDKTAIVSILSDSSPALSLRKQSLDHCFLLVGWTTIPRSDEGKRKSLHSEENKGEIGPNSSSDWSTIPPEPDPGRKIIQLASFLSPSNQLTYKKKKVRWSKPPLVDPLNILRNVLASCFVLCRAHSIRGRIRRPPRARGSRDRRRIKEKRDSLSTIPIRSWKGYRKKPPDKSIDVSGSTRPLERWKKRPPDMVRRKSLSIGCILNPVKIQSQLKCDIFSAVLLIIHRSDTFWRLIHLGRHTRQKRSPFEDTRNHEGKEKRWTLTSLTSSSTIVGIDPSQRAHSEVLAKPNPFSAPSVNFDFSGQELSLNTNTADLFKELADFEECQEYESDKEKMERRKSSIRKYSLINNGTDKSTAPHHSSNQSENEGTGKGSEDRPRFQETWSEMFSNFITGDWKEEGQPPVEATARKEFAIQEATINSSCDVSSSRLAISPRQCRRLGSSLRTKEDHG